MLASPFFGEPVQRVDEARRRYFELGQRPSGLVSEPVLQSWSRCLKAGRGPADRPVFEPVSRSRVSETMERNEWLLRGASSEFDLLERALAGTRCKTLLIDRRGIVVRGSQGSGGNLLDVSARIGVDLSELNFGSTAPSIAAHDNAVCRVAGNEHFHGVLRELHCVAAPVHNRQGQVVGVLDVSIEGGAFAFDALSMVRLSALAIENRLLATPSPDECVVAFQTRASLLDTPLVALAGIDARGLLSWLNPAAQALLPTHALRTRAEDVFGVSADTLMTWSTDDTGIGAPGQRLDPPRAVVLPQGLMVWVQTRVRCKTVRQIDRSESAASSAIRAPLNTFNDAAARPGPGPVGPLPATAAPTSVASDASTAPPLTLSKEASGTSLDAAHRVVIEAALARHRGNVSKTARELGVSRGLLYRRLKAWAASAPD